MNAPSVSKICKLLINQRKHLHLHAMLVIIISYNHTSLIDVVSIFHDIPYCSQAKLLRSNQYYII